MTLPRSIGGVFCDDIREEVSGKLSLIGCYAGGMLVQSFPIVLPKLCAQVRLITPTTQPFNSIKFLVLRDDEVLVEREMPIANIAEAESPDTWDGKINEAHARFIMSPLEIEEPCTIRVRAMVDGELVRGLALRVTQVEPPAAQEADD